MARCPDLSPRDRSILQDLDRVRLLTGRQLERLHFAELASPNVRGSARRRSLGRLERLRLATTLPRRVGGTRAGSAGLVYTLDSRAHRLRELWDDAPLLTPNRIRRPWAIGWPFVAHTLHVAELYVRYREHERAGALHLRRFVAEPLSWFSTTNGVLKPDAYVMYDDQAWEHHRWLEVDRATESGPTVRRKLLIYAELLRAGQSGPDGVLPTVVFTVPSEQRRAQLQRLVDGIQVPADYLAVARFDDFLAGPGRPPP
ncbi:replication-relaxation family protein [uncultured Jatrophihabitans sp.]|uniref:replication-relaxation family protein n=1 Tax=uncultured Jatrophihabitans sp. TaxID=1610747 RepID=UPI0035CB4FE8